MRTILRIRVCSGLGSDVTALPAQSVRGAVSAPAADSSSYWMT
jgi:hypothetical protein